MVALGKQIILFDRSAVFPDQFFTGGCTAEVVTFSVPFARNSAMGMADDFTFQVIDGVKVVAARSGNQVDDRTFVGVFPDGRSG